MDTYDQQPSESHEVWIARLGRHVFDVAPAPDAYRPVWKSLLLSPLLMMERWYFLFNRNPRTTQDKQAKADKR